MSGLPPENVSLFLANAQAVASITTEAATLQEAAYYALAVCAQKELCRLLPVSVAGAPSRAELPQASCKTFAAPALPKELAACLHTKAQEQGIEFIGQGLRAYLAGIDVAFSLAAFGIAETATCCLSTHDEDAHLAGMICETHVIALPKSAMFQTANEAAGILQGMTEQSAVYTSFISGASRTADIERVLAIGVHGPLELHIVLVEAVL